MDSAFSPEGSDLLPYGVSLQVPVYLHRDGLFFLRPLSFKVFGYPLVFQYMISCPQCPDVPLKIYPRIKLPYILK